MKFLFGSIVARIAGAAVLAAGLTAAAQTTTTQVVTVRSRAAGKSTPAATSVQIAPNGTRYKKVAGQGSRAAVTTQTVKATIVHAPATAATSRTAAKPAIRPRPHFAPAPTVVTAQNFGNATVGSTPVTMTLSYPSDTTSPGASSVVPNGTVAPGSATDYIFFGNANVEFGQGGGGQPTNLTNFTVSTLNNVEYPGNGNYTSITAPGGNSAFTTGTLTENPTNYPNTTPHTTLLATFSPLNAGSFTVYILDGNTDGVFVGNSSVGLGVNGGAAVVTASRFLSGTNEFTRYNVANASPSDVFQVYATTSTNSYPTIGGLTFVMGIASGTSGGGLTAATTANEDFQVSSTNCNGGTCSVQVTFTPGFPGLRYDALTLTDSDGNLVYQTYVYGLGMGPQFGYEIGNYTEYDGYLTSPLGVAFGPDDFLYFTQTGSNVITRFPRDFSTSNQITLNGLATPSGIAVDGSNTLYVADQTNNVIFSYSAAGVQGTVTTSPLNGPSQLAVDGTGALYIADTGNGRIIKIDNQGNETTIASGLSSPASVAVDSNGNVFFADSNNNGEILELAAGTTTPTTYTSQMNLTVMNMATDASETIYVTTNQGIAFYRNGNQDGLFYATGADIPVGLAVERNGDVFQTNPLKDKFSMNDRSSSNFILNTPPNTTANGSYPIYNTGNTPLTLTGLSITGPEFQIANSPPQCTPPQVIAPAKSCTVNISFLPPLAQYYTDTAIATSNSLNMPGTTDPFYLAGSGIGAPSTTTLSAAPSQVQSGSPVELLVTVSDSPMTFTPSGPVTFMEGSFVLGTATLVPGSLAGTATATLTISSIPLGIHTYTAAFPGDANVSPSTSSNLNVTGYTAGSQPNGPITTVNFGNQTLGGAATTSVTLPNNTGRITSTNPEFSSDTLNCASSCTANVAFFPEFPGLRTGAYLAYDSEGTYLGKVYAYGVGLAPLFGFDPANLTLYSGTVGAPGAEAFGPDRSLYLADNSTNTIFLAVNNVFQDSSNPAPIVQLPIVNLGTIGGIAVDGGNKIYISDQTNNLIVTYDQVMPGMASAQGAIATSPLSSPTGVAVDAAGNLYIADTGHSRIIEIDNQGNETTAVSGVEQVGPLAVDSMGGLYYAISANAGSIMYLTAGGGAPTLYASGISNIHGLAVDASQRVYYTNDAGLSILPLPSCSGCSIEGVATQFPAQALDGVVLDGGGDIFTTQPSTGFFGLLVRAGGNSAVTGPVGMSTAGTPFLVSNLGNMPLTIGSIAFQDSSTFNAGSGSTCTNGTVLQAGSNCNIAPKFTPSQPQPYTDPVTFTSNNANSPGSTNTYTLNGTGVPAGGGLGTTTLGLSPTGLISLGQTLTLTATVTGVTSSAPTGTVNFLSNGVAIASGTLVRNGTSATASVVIMDPSLAVGTFTITAMYAGDANNPSSSSTSQSINVTQGTPPITVSGQSTIMVGQNETLTATIVGLASTAPTGSVTFLDGDSTLGVMDVGQTSTGGTATLTTSSLSVGTHIITAQYSGDANYNSVNSSPFTVTVSILVSSTNFGSVTVGSSNSMTLTFPAVQGLFKNANSADFKVSNLSCNSTCAVTVTFRPQSPGLRYAAISLLDDDDNPVAKTFVYGTGLAPQFAFDPPYNPSTTTPYSADNAAGIAVGPDGTVYVSDSSHGKVTAYPIGGDSTSIPVGTAADIGAIAVDGSNTVYIADTENDVVIASNAAGVVTTVQTSSPLGYPQAIAVDGTGALYINDTDNEQILKIDNQGNETTLASPGESAGMAVDAAGDVFYTDINNDGGVIYELPANGGSTITVASNLPYSISSLAIDAAGRLYYLSSDDTDASVLTGLSPGTSGYGSTFTEQLPPDSGRFSGGLAITPTGGILAGEITFGAGSVMLFDRMEAGSTTSAQVGSTASIKFPISNTGDTPLTISSLSLNSPAFTIDPESACHSGSTVAPDRECLVTVDFTPPAAQNYQAPLTVTTNNLNATGTQNVFTLNGVGGDSSSLDFEISNNSINLGQSVTLSATVTDNVSSATPTGTVTFQVGGPVGTVNLVAGSTPGTATASYTYTPTQTGSYFTDATYNGDSTIAPLTGTGQTLQVNQAVAPAVVTSQNFGSVAVGQSATMTLNFSQGVDSRISIASGLEFNDVAQTCNTMCSVTISFTPLVPGLRQDAILISDQSGNLLAKAYLYGTGTGPQFGFLPGQSSIDTTYASPTAITFTPDGVGFVTDAATRKVYPLYDGAQPFPIVGLGAPSGIAVDGARTFYIADQTNNRIVTFNQPNYVQGVLSTSPLSSPSGVATDGTGAVYIADKGNNRIIKIDNQGTETTLASGLSSPLAVALDAVGNVYFSDASNGNEIAEIPVAGGAPVRLFGALGTTGLAVDASGSVYSVGSSFSGIHDYISVNSAIGFSGATTGSLTGIGINYNGDIWTMQSSTGQLEELHRGSTNFYSSTPAGVSKQHTVQVVNTGNAPLTISNLAFATGTVFTLGAGSPCASGTVLAAASECDTYVEFLPPSAGSYSDLLTYTTNTLNAAGSTNSDNENGAGTGSGGAVPSTTTFVASPSSVMVGQTISVTATVSDTTGVTPTGIVQFLNGVTPVASGTLSASATSGTATATATIPPMAAGAYSIVAAYGGDPNVAASQSAAQQLTFTPASAAPTTISFETSAGSPTAYGYPIELLATVTVTASGAPATPGQVIFCDASLPRCNLLSNLGIAQTNSAGRATLPINPGIIGTHTYQAVFLGTTLYTAATSTTQQVTVAGTYQSTTTITSSGSAGDYSLTGTVAGLGSRTLSPTGSVSFMDNSDSQTLGAANLGAATLGFSAVQPTGSPISVGTNPYGVAAGDLNGDGFVDVVVENYLSNTVSVLLGNGNGTFLPQVTYAVGNRPERVLIADFNGDGYMDLVVANTGSSTVSVLLNKGNGTFYPQVTYPVGSPVGLGVMDLNHDGIADIVAADYYSNTVSVLLGNGDGTFKTAVTYPAGNTPQTLSEGDFNNDGNIDLAVGNVGDGTVSVFLGNGDGTFQAQVTHSVGSGGPGGLQVGDLNGDGNADIAVANSSLGNVGVLLGNGNGTFQEQVTYPVGTDPIGLVIADFDGDGKLDLSVGNGGQNSLYQSILLGNGDGTFKPQLTFPTGNFPYGTAVGDFNGDGYPDMAISNWNDGTATILLSQISQTATATINGVTISGTPPGTHTVEAIYAGDTNFLTSTSTVIPLMQGGNPGETITGVTFTGSAAKPTITISGSGFNPEPTGDNEPMSFYGQTGQDFGATGLYIMDGFGAGQDGDAIGLINVSYTDTLITFQFGSDYPSQFPNALAEGDSYTVSVDGLTFSGTVHYSLTPQTITFPSIPNHVYGDAPFTLGATASSGLAVSYAVTSGPATVSGSTVTITGVGMVTIQATQAGNASYAAATPVSQSFTVAQASQTITFPGIPNQVTTAAPFTLSATASSGLTVSYTVTSGPATVSGSTVTLTGAAGTVVIQATQAGNTNYSAATPVSQSFTVAVATGASTTTALTTNAGTGVAYEKPVILTASVKTGAGAPVTVGQVIFCSAAATYCNVNANLGVGQLNVSGVAVLSVGSGVVGSHGYIADFLGTTAYAASTSATQTVTVTGSFPSTTAIAATGSAGNYNLTGTVVGIGSATLSPTGNVSFIDTTNANATLGSAALGSATASYNQSQSSQNVTGSDPYDMATGDFNGDGLLDMVTADFGAGEITVLLGNGDGTFQAGVNYTVGSGPDAIKLADFNGDGHLDIVVTNQNDQDVSVLLGNGDGTFQPQVTYAVSGRSPASLGVMDLNHDGIADIVTANDVGNNVSVLIGNGDGTFQTAVSYAAGRNADSVAEADFNGDGNIDLAVGNVGGSTVSILLGNGDGTFQTQITYAVNGEASAVKAGDFNGDGKADLAVSNYGNNTVSILLGNGDGTFQTVVPYSVGNGPYSIAVADFNGDGKQDIAVGNATDMTVSFLLGNGNGTFQLATQLTFSDADAGFTGLTAADFNGDGLPDLAVPTVAAAGTSNNGTVAVRVGQLTQTATATITGVALGGSPGTHNVDAVYAGDSHFTTSTSSAIPLTRGLLSQTITFPSIPNHVVTDAPFALGAAASSGLTVSYSVTSGPAAVSGNTVTITGVGMVMIQATQAGNSTYAAATPVSQSFTVAQASQTITFPAIPNHVATDAPFALGATASSGLPVTYMVTSGPATVSGSTVTLTGTGAVVIQASQAGNSTYAAATPVSQSFIVSLAPQTITFPSIPNHAFGDAPFVLNATASSGLSISYAVTSGPATVSGNTVTITGAGAVTIQATQAGNTTYAAATPASQSFTVATESQTITFPAIPNHSTGDAPFTLGATASSGLAVTYTVTSGPATVAGNVVTLTGAGTVVIQAAQAGNATYAAATPVSQSFAVLPGAPTLVSITPSSGVLNSGATTITLTGSSFAATDIVQLNGAALASTYVNATTLTAIIPASFFTTAGTGQVTVVDSSGRTTTAQTFTVVMAPAINFSGPATTTSGAQPTLTLQLVNPYPQAISGTLTLTFTPSGANGVDDPAVQFSTGGRTMSFTIPALSTVTPTVQIQSGTVAGVATITLLTTSNGVNVTPANVTPVQITIAAAAPIITTSAITRSGNSLSVTVDGFSNTRELSMAIFHFTAVPGSTISTPDITAPVGTVFGNYFSSTASAGYGSTFVYIQAFNLNNDASSIQSVTVTLVNTQGNSMVSTAQ